MFSDLTLVGPSSPGNYQSSHTFSNVKILNLYYTYYIYFSVSWATSCCYYTQNYYGIFSSDYTNINGQFTDSTNSNPYFPFGWDATQVPRSTTTKASAPLPTGKMEAGIWSTLNGGTAGLYIPSFSSYQTENNLLPNINSNNAFTEILLNMSTYDLLYSGEYYAFSSTFQNSYVSMLISSTGQYENWIHGTFSDSKGRYTFEGINSLNGDYTNRCVGTPSSGTFHSGQGFSFATLSNGWPGTLRFTITDNYVSKIEGQWANYNLPYSQSNSNSNGYVYESIINPYQIQKVYACYLSFYRPGPKQSYYAIWTGRSLHGAFYQAGDPTAYPFDGYMT